MADQIALEVMDERLQRREAAINRDQLAFNETSVGRACPVLIERKGKLPGQMLGKSPWLQSVHLITGAAVGDMVAVTIDTAGPNSVGGVTRLRAAASPGPRSGKQRTLRRGTPQAHDALIGLPFAHGQQNVSGRRRSTRTPM